MNKPRTERHAPLEPESSLATSDGARPDIAPTPCSRPDAWTAGHTCTVSLRRRTFVWTAPAACVLVTAALAFANPPATQAPSTRPSASASVTLPAPDAEGSPLQKARRGVVILERAGRALGMGVVLGADGRLLTALSVVGDGIGVDARYADGSVVNVRVGHSDRTWDLALLVPQVGRWEEGLGATSGDPLQAGTRLRAFTQGNRQVRLASVVLAGRGDLLGGDAAVLRDALLITTRVPSSDVGTPLVDDSGQVMAIVSRACSPADSSAHRPCKPVAFGVPTEVLKQFLRSAPANAVPPTPWLGIQGLAAETPIVRGVRVVGVHPDSPASHAGLLGAEDVGRADIIVAVDGTPVQSAERLSSLVRERAVGETIELIVLRQGRYQLIKVVLEATSPARSRLSAPGR